jgi:hypothetical protein
MSTPFPPEAGIGIYNLTKKLTEKEYVVRVVTYGSLEMENDFIDDFRKLIYFWRSNI